MNRNERKYNSILLKLLIISIIINIILITKVYSSANYEEDTNVTSNMYDNNVISNACDNKEIMSIVNPNDWKIVLVNKDNILPDNFKVELADIDEHRKFDARAINELNNMISEMRKSDITNIWVQSAYRSIEQQQTLFNNRVNKYISQGKSKSEAEILTSKVISKAGTSEHNLGLAVDFNYVSKNFEKTKAFNWLLKNAEDYGFILRYSEDKESITGISYEPWHWRYVGIEHAKVINQMNFCLEEYIDYLSK